MSNSPKIIAHRGGAAWWPENTLVAVAGALSPGNSSFDGIELDVHASKDGEVIVHHDATLSRMTNAEGPLSSYTTAELRRIDNHQGGGHVPSLSEALSLFPARGVTPSIELKRDASGERYPGLDRTVEEVLIRSHVDHRPYIHAFDWDYLDSFATGGLECDVAANISREELKKCGGLLKTICHLKERQISHVNIDHRLMTGAVIKAFHEAKMEITLWTVNEAADLKRFRDVGIYAIATDVPELARTIYGR